MLMCMHSARSYSCTISMLERRFKRFIHQRLASIHFKGPRSSISYKIVSFKFVRGYPSLMRVLFSSNEVVFSNVTCIVPQLLKFFVAI